MPELEALHSARADTVSVPVVSEKAKPPKSRPSTPQAGATGGKEASAKDDVAIVWGRAEDGRMNILRKRAHRLEVGTVQPLREGVPIHGEVIQLQPRPDSPLCDVQVLVPGQRQASDRNLPVRHDAASAQTATALPGPAQVASDAYRKNWDSIWRRKPDASDLN